MRPFVLSLAQLSAAILFIALLFTCAPEAVFARSSLTDDQVRERMIQESIGSYSGNCPCPYNLARNGSSCGKRSAYSKPGGAVPLCYKSDITDEMVKAWRRRKSQ